MPPAEEDARIKLMDRWKDLDLRFLRMDHLDIRILDMLLEDSRRSNVDLAKDLDVSEATIRKRIGCMEKMELIRGYTTEVDLGVVESSVKAYVTMKVESRLRPKVIRWMCQHPRSLAVYRTAGDDSVLSVMLFTDSREFQDFADNHSMIEGVQSVSIQVVMTPYKGFLSSGV